MSVKLSTTHTPLVPLFASVGLKKYENMKSGPADNGSERTKGFLSFWEMR